MSSGGDWYAEWVRLHATATGADAAAVRALLSDFVRDVLLDSGRTTPEELGAVTVRLLARHGTPKFANEHSDAVGAELVRLREERRLAAVRGAAGERDESPGPGCDACGGCGLATVPLRACVRVERAGGAEAAFLVPHPEWGGLRTGAVLCDRPGCAAGELARAAERHRLDKKPRRPTLSQVSRELGCDPAALLREHERAEARRARAAGGAGAAEWAALVAQMVSRCLRAAA